LKKYIILIILVLMSSPAYAWMPIVVRGGAAAAPAGCTTEHANNASAITGDMDNKTSANYTWTGQGKYNPGATIDVCAVTFVLTAVTNGTTITDKNYSVEIYTYSGDNLDTLQGSASTPQAGVDAWSETSVKFLFASSVTLTNGTDYAIVLTHDAIVDTQDFAEVEYTANDALDGLIYQYADDKTQTTFGANDTKIIIFKD